MRQIVFQYQRDFSLNFGLQHPGERHIGVIAVAHVGKQSAEVRLVNPQLLLHFRMGEPHLAPHHPATVRDVVLYVNPLDGVGRLRVIDAENIAQRFNSLSRCFRFTQALCKLFKR